ncbi:MAG TPA: maleylpyruvate isomerase family mycothiol-dependent enzyme [Acidimicrobiales bacterium]
MDRDHIVAALDEVWDALVSLAGELDYDDWERPTACPGWTVRDQFSHVLGTEAMLLGRERPAVELPPDLPHVRNDIGRLNELWVQAYRTRSVAELVADLGEIILARRVDLANMDQEAFDAESWTPAGQDTYGRFMQIRVMDQWFHEQDVREAVGRRDHLDGLAPEVALDEVTLALGYIVGKKADAPAGSSVSFRLTGSLTRRIDVEVTDRARVVEEVANPTVTLSIPAERFFRIAGGRLGDRDPVDTSIGIEGDRELGERVLRQLPFTL